MLDPDFVNTDYDPYLKLDEDVDPDYIAIPPRDFICDS